MFRPHCVLEMFCGGFRERWTRQPPVSTKQGCLDSRSDPCQIYEIITKGVNKMPAFGKSLGEQKVKQLVAYIRELGKKR